MPLWFLRHCITAVRGVHKCDCESWNAGTWNGKWNRINAQEIRNNKQEVLLYD